ncbi:MAG TPA: hypothetical protein VNX68_10415 [Nitrosopumilaceae archaeon]|jgi:hypothetical protein|nr:hypothetical protein [Nitrosopumilaceae archaeon]
MAKKKVKVDIEKFLEATGFLYRLNKIPTEQLDFTCIFDKDLTLKQKKELGRYTDNNKVLSGLLCMYKWHEKEFGVKLRKDIKVTHEGEAWGAEVIKPKSIPLDVEIRGILIDYFPLGRSNEMINKCVAKIVSTIKKKK